ncbi:MAG: hypothetical protein QOF76_1525 [Solirubrobacteraceae bacterium]|nr:hypothetical protein [Solirubrobacteraceae bacterium]
MITRRTVHLPANREAIWAIVGDPHHEPRWWPLTNRVEGVTKRGWTSVATSSRGNQVRTDWTLVLSETPTRRRWAQEIEGTPFERIFVRNEREIQLERLDDGTRVTLLFDQKARGLANYLPFMLKRAMKRQIDQALAGLAELF